MKTVAILTMHRVLNYGSILQTVALASYLESKKLNVVIIDYKFPNDYHRKIASKRAVKEVNKNWIQRHLNGLCSRMLKVDDTRRQRLFNDFMSRHLRLSESYNTESDLQKAPVKADIYITGSDQVWNPRYIGDDLSFFLNWVPEGNRKISYGSSFGSVATPEYQAKRILPLLEKYEAISVREGNDIFQRENIRYEVVLDPTLLLSKEQWYKFINPVPLVKEKYILCYLIGYSYNPFPYVDKLVSFLHKKTGLKVVMIAGEPRNLLKGYKLFNDCGPEEFLNLFYYSSIVVTTSFHGTAFAINFHKPFLTIVDDKSSEDNRQQTIVNIVGLKQDCIVECNTPLENIQIPKLGDSIAPNLELVRQKSRNFLDSSIENE